MIVLLFRQKYVCLLPCQHLAGTKDSDDTDDFTQLVLSLARGSKNNLSLTPKKHLFLLISRPISIPKDISNMKACWSSLMSNPRKSGYAGSMASFRTISFVDSSSRDTPFCIWTENVDHVVRFTSKNETSSPPKQNKLACNCKTGDNEWRRDGVFTQSKEITGVHIS